MCSMVIINYAMRFTSFILLSSFCLEIANGREINNERSKRYLLMTPGTQWGVFATVTIPLHPETTTSVAWFFEANYFVVDNATYFEPLLGDITVSRDRTKRSSKQKELWTRSFMYHSIEAMLEKYGYPGRACLLRAVCENSKNHFHHNGLLGDILHVFLTPSTSELEDDIEDCFYEAEYLGEEENNCQYYEEDCPTSPLEFISMFIDD